MKSNPSQSQSPAEKPETKVIARPVLPPAPARWKWMAGSAAAAAAAGTVADAALVQITQVDNRISSNLGNALNADLTGDGVADLFGLKGTFYSGLSTGTTPGKIYYQSRGNASASSAYRRFGSADFNLRRTVTTIAASTTTSTSIFSAGVGAFPYRTYNTGTTPQTASKLFQIAFSDARINGGNLTGGWFEVKSSANLNDAKVELVRLVFDDANTNYPAGVVAGGQNAAFDPTKAARLAALESQAAALESQIGSLKKKIKKLKRRGKRDRARKLKRKLRRLQAQAGNLQA